MANETHILRRTEVISANAASVFKVLTDISQHYQQFALSTTSVEILTPERSFGRGFMWRETRRVLFLRDTCTFIVTEYDEQALAYGVCMEDGFNKVQYTFRVEALSAATSRVYCAVDCRTRLQSSGSELCQPSERLACMMANQDGLLVKRLKHHIESSHSGTPDPVLPVQCC